MKLPETGYITCHESPSHAATSREKEALIEELRTSDPRRSYLDECEQCKVIVTESMALSVHEDTAYKSKRQTATLELQRSRKPYTKMIPLFETALFLISA
jgi:hypothetical protein